MGRMRWSPICSTRPTRDSDRREHWNDVEKSRGRRIHAFEADNSFVSFFDAASANTVQIGMYIGQLSNGDTSRALVHSDAPYPRPLETYS